MRKRITKYFAGCLAAVMFFCNSGMETIVNAAEMPSNPAGQEEGLEEVGGG